MNVKFLIVLGSLIALLSAVNVYLNISHPYGVMFDLSIAGFALGLVALFTGALMLCKAKSFKTGVVLSVVPLGLCLTLMVTAVVDHRLLYRLLMPINTSPLSTQQWREDILWLRTAKAQGMKRSLLSNENDFDDTF